MSLRLWSRLEGQSAGVVRSEIGVNGTVVGDVSFDSAKYGKGAWRSGDAGGNWSSGIKYVNTSNPFLNYAQGAIEFMLFVAYYPASTYSNYALMCGDIASSFIEPLIIYWDTSTNLSFFPVFGSGNPVSYDIPNFNSMITLSTWMHFALTWNRNKIHGSATDYVQLRVNNILKYSGTTAPSSWWGTTNGSGNIKVGTGISSGYSTKRYQIDNLKIHDDDRIDFNDRVIEGIGFSKRRIA